MVLLIFDYIGLLQIYTLWQCMIGVLKEFYMTFVNSDWCQTFWPNAKHAMGLLKGIQVIGVGAFLQVCLCYIGALPSLLCIGSIACQSIGASYWCKLLAQCVKGQAIGHGGIFSAVYWLFTQPCVNVVLSCSFCVVCVQALLPQHWYKYVVCRFPWCSYACKCCLVVGVQIQCNAV